MSRAGPLNLPTQPGERLNVRRIVLAGPRSQSLAHLPTFRCSALKPFQFYQLRRSSRLPSGPHDATYLLREKHKDPRNAGLWRIEAYLMLRGPLTPSGALSRAKC